MTLDWATYLGGPDFEEAREPIALAGGRVLFSARVVSTNLPTTAGAIQRQYGGGSSDTYLGILSADGRTLEAATYFGGSGFERPAYGMEIANDGDIVFTSGTNSVNLPTTPGAYLTQNTSPADAGFVCRVTASLTSIVWCTYISGWPRGGLALTPTDEVIVVGRVPTGSNFTATAGAYQTAQRGPDDAFVTKLSANGASLIFQTRIGGLNSDIGEVAMSANVVGNDVLVSGISQSPDFPVTANAFQKTSSGPRDVFVVRLSGNGSQLSYSTLLGGSDQDVTSHRDALMPDGSIIVVGRADSHDVQGATGSLRGTSDFLVARFDPAGGNFDWIRYLGGTGTDRGIGRAIDADGRIIVVGETDSRDFPVSTNAVQATYGGGASDGTIVILDGNGEILYSSYLGGSGDDWIRGVATGPNGTIFVVGSTTSDDLPVSAGALQTTRGGAEDAFIARLTLSSGG
ncbi:MAG TPA: SBBP repeat-containing protein [Longimicrobiales bacterium]